MLGFAAVLALNLLTKGLIGIVFPILFAILYLAFTRELPLLRKLSILPSTLLFLAIALPWHILAALRNPAIPMPAGLGLPQKAGWAWFYLYNEHIARFLGRRIPHDYGQVPIPIFWLLLVLWLFPWAAFLPTAVIGAVKNLRDRAARSYPRTIPRNRVLIPFRLNEALRATLLWAGIILGFFTLSSRQEYYHLPALPALALLVGGLLATADDRRFSNPPFTADPRPAPSAPLSTASSPSARFSSSSADTSPSPRPHHAPASHSTTSSVPTLRSTISRSATSSTSPAPRWASSAGL